MKKLFFPLITILLFLSGGCTGIQYRLDRLRDEPKYFHIPLDQRQLFFDEYGVLKIENLESKLHQPTKIGAVIEPDQPWEFSLQIRCAPVWDPQMERFKIWMITSTTIPGVAEMTYAESKDGINWYKPILRQKEIDGNLENNIFTLDPKLEWPANAIENVVFDPDDPNPSRRFKGLANIKGREPIISEDGIHWKRLAVSPIPSSDESNLSYDQLTGMFIATLKVFGPYGRSHAIWTSDDFEIWNNLNVIFHADEIDQELGQKNMEKRVVDLFLNNAQTHLKNAKFAESKTVVDVYNFGVARYESIYIGFPAMFHNNGHTAFHLVQLACSRDLIHWKRLGERKTFIGPSNIKSDAYDLTQILPPSFPVVRDNELWFYYTGIKYRYPPKGVEKNGAICLAKLRRDGFISMNADDKEGILITRPFIAPSTKLFVNVDATEGELRAEVFGENDLQICHSAPIKGDKFSEEVRWLSDKPVDFEGEIVNIQFTLRNASFYSYWFNDN